MIVARGKARERRRNQWDGEDWAAWAFTTLIVVACGVVLAIVGRGVYEAWQAAPAWVLGGVAILTVAGGIAAYIVNKWGPNA